MGALKPVLGYLGLLKFFFIKLSWWLMQKIIQGQVLKILHGNRLGYDARVERDM